MSGFRQAQPPVAGDEHMWVFVLGEFVIFGGYFVIYSVFRTMHASQYLAAQQHLGLTAGAVNTIVLLTSSWCVVRAVQQTRRSEPGAAIRSLLAGGGLGGLFVALKLVEWHSQIRAGHTNSDPFFMFWFVLTGVHLLHVLIGLIALGIGVRELQAPDRRRPRLVESVAIYWHMVDLLWVAIFGLLYCVR